MYKCSPLFLCHLKENLYKVMVSPYTFLLDLSCLQSGPDFLQEASYMAGLYCALFLLCHRVLISKIVSSQALD